MEHTLKLSLIHIFLTYDELKEFFSSNSDLPKISRDIGIKPIHIERIRYCIDYFESIKGKYPRWRVNICLDKILRKFSEYREIEKIRVTGSLRRRKAFVGDMDLLLLLSLIHILYPILFL